MSAFACEFHRDGTAKPFAGRRDDGYATGEPQLGSGAPLKTSILSRMAAVG